MSTTFDPFWIAAQLQLTPAQLLAVPFGIIAVLWLASRMSEETQPGNFIAASRTSQVMRFLLGLSGGLAILLIGLELIRMLVGELQAG
jgi:hypothetical protein